MAGWVMLFFFMQFLGNYEMTEVETCVQVKFSTRMLVYFSSE